MLVKSQDAVAPQELLEKFAAMAKKSKALDGDWQGDGWGVSWLDENNEWQVYTSVKPVWEDTESFSIVPKTHMLTAHARSASFPSQKGVLEYNQPYINGKYSYVFNGLLFGVTLSSSIPGKIGAQKVWSILQNFLGKYPAEVALEKVQKILSKNSKRVQALNIGLADGEHIYTLNCFDDHKEYYGLRVYQDKDMTIVCSEPLEGIEFRYVETSIGKW